RGEREGEPHFFRLLCGLKALDFRLHRAPPFVSSNVATKVPLGIRLTAMRLSTSSSICAVRVCPTKMRNASFCAALCSLSRELAFFERSPSSHATNPFSAREVLMLRIFIAPSYQPL